MMRKLILLALACLILFPCSLWSQNLRNAQFIQTIESRRDGRLFQARTWMKQGHVRMEYSAQGQPLVSLIRGAHVYNFSLRDNKGGAITAIHQGTGPQGFGPEVIQSKNDLMEFLDLMHAKKVGHEVINNKLCEIYTYHDAQKQADTKIWLWQEEFFPVKSTIDIGHDLVTITYEQIQLNRPIEDQLFEVPEDVEFQDLTSKNPI